MNISLFFTVSEQSLPCHFLFPLSLLPSSLSLCLCLCLCLPLSYTPAHFCHTAHTSASALAFLLPSSACVTAVRKIILSTSVAGVSLLHKLYATDSLILSSLSLSPSTSPSPFPLPLCTLALRALSWLACTTSKVDVYAGRVGSCDTAPLAGVAVQRARERDPHIRSVWADGGNPLLLDPTAASNLIFRRASRSQGESEGRAVARTPHPRPSPAVIRSAFVLCFRRQSAPGLRPEPLLCVCVLVCLCACTVLQWSSRLTQICLDFIFFLLLYSFLVPVFPFPLISLPHPHPRTVLDILMQHRQATKARRWCVLKTDPSCSCASVDLSNLGVGSVALARRHVLTEGTRELSRSQRISSTFTAATLLTTAAATWTRWRGWLVR